MNQRIVVFFPDAAQHWVAKLESGHNPHVRHDPPLFFVPLKIYVEC
jgi:hypothetical protein